MSKFYIEKQWSDLRRNTVNYISSYLMELCWLDSYKLAQLVGRWRISSKLLGSFTGQNIFRSVGVQISLIFQIFKYSFLKLALVTYLKKILYRKKLFLFFFNNSEKIIGKKSEKTSRKLCNRIHFNSNTSWHVRQFPDLWQ